MGIISKLNEKLNEGTFTQFLEKLNEGVEGTILAKMKEIERQGEEDQVDAVAEEAMKVFNVTAKYLKDKKEEIEETFYAEEVVYDETFYIRYDGDEWIIEIGFEGKDAGGGGEEIQGSILLTLNAEYAIVEDDMHTY